MTSFLIKEEVASEGAKFVLLALTRGRKQLSPKQDEEARAISHVRIHVEQAIGRI